MFHHNTNKVIKLAYEIIFVCLIEFYSFSSYLCLCYYKKKLTHHSDLNVILISLSAHSSRCKLCLMSQTQFDI